MEYRYKKGPSKWLILYGILAVLVIATFLTDTYWNGFNIYRFFMNLIIPLIFMLYNCYTIYRYYKMTATDIISLDDKGLTHTRKGAVARIKWNDIDKVEWHGKNTESYSALTVFGTDQVIGIGEHIDGLDEIIQFIKTKVGAKFNTNNIPWEKKTLKTNRYFLND